MSLGLRVALRTVILLVCITAIIFLPAGTWHFWQGWAFLAAFALPPTFASFYFLRYDRSLMERRMRARENVPEQRLLMAAYSVLFFGGLMLPGFDHRLGWSSRWVGEVPLFLTVIALVLVFAGFLFIFWVMKVNSFAGRTIRVDEGQHVISTGPYACVRHPMYLGASALATAASLALGSWIALPIFALTIPIWAMRLLNEEKVLRAELPGYAEYCQKTPYHLIPFVW